MFLGQYDHSIDEKGRLTIPARFRELLDNGAFITKGLDQNLMVLPAAVFEQVYKKVNEQNYGDPRARKLSRLVFGSAVRADVDRVGRILIPQFLRQAISLDGPAMIVGVGAYFEIWSQEQWLEQSKELLDDDANQERFSGLDLKFNL
jgi:MraZ protein